jgi:hypothetical protein
MLELLTAYNLTGLAIGLITFIIIGLFHPLVIKFHYYWGTMSWIFFVISGIAFVIFSILVTKIFFSIILGVLAFSSFWSILEIFAQEKRVNKGWFPQNQKRK